MTYPPPHGQQYPQQGQPYPQQPMPPVKKKTAAWWIIPAVIAGVCGLGLVAGAIGDDKNSDKSAETSVRAAPTAAAPAFSAPAQPTSTVPPVQNVAIPDVVGKNGAIASDELKKAGFTNVTHGSATPGVDLVMMLSNWTVTSIEPGAGTVIPTDSAIVLTMTKNNSR